MSEQGNYITVVFRCDGVFPAPRVKALMETLFEVDDDGCEVVALAAGNVLLDGEPE